MFERSSQRKRSDFEQMKKNFNIDSIEASEQMSSLRRRGRSSERERRGRRGGDRDVRRGTRGGARGGARGGVVGGGVEGDVAGGTDVLMEDVF